jgi:hypothetical protein
MYRCCVSLRRLFDEALAAAATSPSRSGTAARARILAATEPHGCSGGTLLGQGFRVGMLADLVSDGLATAHRETMKAGKREAARVRIRITDAGRQALEG